MSTHPGEAPGIRFETGELIASGGSGDVYRAWDPELERPIAVKHLRNGNPDEIARLLHEAKAQASVDHPNVCPVYEVGTFGDLPFIAMAWIEGRPLDEALRDLPLEARVATFAQVVDGVQAAHSAGLIHRDLKPANVLVELREDGDRVPYVLDFGISRLEGLPGVTRTGEIIGTPGYMSPEQARGETTTLDRRSDVFSLGCMLYELITGTAPFSAESGVASLIRVLREAPEPLATGVVPRDLSVIVGKCLEKEPKRRYGSARELADDLRRFLRGETARARPPSPWRSFQGWCRRRPVLATAGGVALLASLVLGTATVHQRATATQQAHLARRFGERVERLGTTLRLAHLSAPHDVGPERDRLRTELEQIAEEATHVGRAAFGPGEFALGRGRLLLGDLAEAEDHLRAAWEEGYRAPEVARTLAAVLAERYREALRAADRERDAGERARRIAEARTEILRPARELLAEGRAVGGDVDRLLEARLAFYEGDLERAEDWARQAVNGRPWLYEIDLLRAEIALSRALAASHDGDPEAAAGHFAAARRSARAAAEQGRSDAATYETLCRTNALEADQRFFGSATFREADVLAVEEACGRALAVEPGRVSVWLELSTLRLQAARAAQRRGDDPTEGFARALAAAQSVMELAPTDARGPRDAGEVLTFWAGYEREIGRPPEVFEMRLEESLRFLQTAIRLDPRDAEAHNIMGLGEWEAYAVARERGRDPLAPATRATAAFERAVALRPGFERALSNLGTLHRIRGDLLAERGLDPTPAYDAAIEALERALVLDRDHVYSVNNLGTVHRARGAYLTRSGGDGGPDLERALELYSSAAERSPEWSFPWLNKGITWRLVAASRQRLGGDVAPALMAAHRAFEAGIERRANHAAAWGEWASTYLQAARWKLEEEGSATVELDAADETLDRGFEVRPAGWAQGYLLRAKVRCLRLLDGEVPPSRAARFRAAAEKALDEALILDPSSAEGASDLCVGPVRSDRRPSHGGGGHALASGV